MRNKPIINHVSVIVKGVWITRTFLPLFDNQLMWAENVKCGEGCPLASCCHPMVEDDIDPYCYHKLCTLTVIKAGLITKREIIGAD